MLEPIKLKGCYKNYIWGGNRLAQNFHKEKGMGTIAESWELSAHQDGYSRIESGEYQGENLVEYLNAIGKKALGLKNQNQEQLPILIKLIDAKEALSIQVHPDDAYAWKHEHDNGKTEMWVILDHEPGAFLYYGVNQEITKEELKQRIENHTLTEVLCKVPVHKGDVFFIEAGMIHAIGAGIVLCEIQQTSNVTYRIYDYGRKDAQGKERPLHVQQAMEVACLKPKPCNVLPETILMDTEELSIALLRSCRYFSTYEYQIKHKVEFHVSKESFCSVIVTQGSAVLSYDDTLLHLEKGETAFVPAQDHILKMEGDCTFLVVTL